MFRNAIFAALVLAAPATAEVAWEYPTTEKERFIPAAWFASKSEVVVSLKDVYTLDRATGKLLSVIPGVTNPPSAAMGPQYFLGSRLFDGRTGKELQDLNGLVFTAASRVFVYRQMKDEVIGVGEDGKTLWNLNTRDFGGLDILTGAQGLYFQVHRSASGPRAEKPLPGRAALTCVGPDGKVAWKYVAPDKDMVGVSEPTFTIIPSGTKDLAALKLSNEAHTVTMIRLIRDARPFDFTFRGDAGIVILQRGGVSFPWTFERKGPKGAQRFLVLRGSGESKEKPAPVWVVVDAETCKEARRVPVPADVTYVAEGYVITKERNLLDVASGKEVMKVEETWSIDQGLGAWISRYQEGRLVFRPLDGSADVELPMKARPWSIRPVAGRANFALVVWREEDAKPVKTHLVWLDLASGASGEIRAFDDTQVEVNSAFADGDDLFVVVATGPGGQAYPVPRILRQALK